ncbi:MAG: hypothetical protein R3D32_07190 [Nitratireductor sp.]
MTLSSVEIASTSAEKVFHHRFIDDVHALAGHVPVASTMPSASFSTVKFL